jgi:hypothetical protein
MSFINIADKISPKNPLLQMHDGTVVDNNDPLKLGRVRVTIPNVLQSTDPKRLPWMKNIQPAGLGGSIHSNSVNVPEIGSQLIIIFPHNNIYFGYFIGYSQNKKIHNDFFDLDYPNSYGWVDSAGNKFRINKKSGIIDIIHLSGTHIQILKDGTISVTSVASLNLAAVTMNLSAETGSINFGSGTIDIGSGNVNVGSGDVKASGISLTGHTHFAPHDAGNTGAPQ